jgi:Tol biopolymer transport system component
MRLLAALLLGLSATAFATSVAGPASAPPVNDRQQVYVVRSDGQELRRLTDGRRYYDSPAWSRDGKRLAFTSSSAGGASVIEVLPFSSGRSRRLRLDRRLGRPSEPEWSPRRDELAFSAIREETQDIRRTVAIARSDGSKLRRLAEHEFGAVVPSGPVWSPDGDRIAYIRQRKYRPPTRPEREPEVHPTTEALDVVIATRGGRKRRVALRGDDVDPRWSPDGKWILLVRKLKRESLDLWRLPAGGGRPRPVVRGAVDAFSADWSPQSDHVCFTGLSRAVDLRIHLFVSDVYHRTQPRLIRRVVAQLRPVWSNENLIAFADYDGNVRVIAPDGSGERTLATLPGAVFYDLAWSPDGRWLAFTAARKPVSD